MSCENCFNGCADIVSDKCVKYTGIPIPGLGIDTGDSLFFVEQQITTKILTLMDGTGIIPVIDPIDVCALVSGFFPCCAPFDLNVVLTAYVKAICDINDRLIALDGRVVIVEQALIALNADYTLPLDCLTGVTASSDTHDILQAVIDKLCAVADSLTLYVRKDELDDLIAAYLATNVPADLVSNKMIPWMAVPFFDPNTLSYFASDGSGLDLSGSGGKNWTKIYLCNGANNTPDLRGRSLVGVSSMPGAPTTDPATIPSINGNPNYALSDVAGANQVILNNAQVPSHIHLATATSTDSGHTHTIAMGRQAVGSGNQNAAANDNTTPSGTPVDPRTSSVTSATIHTDVVVQPSAQGGSAVPIIQPVRASYWIIYIP